MISSASSFRSRLAGRVGCAPEDIGAVACVAKDVSIGRGGDTLTVIANTDDIDLEGEVVVPGGADLSYFQANRSVFVDHQYGVGDLAGKMRNVARVLGDDGEIKAWKVSIAMTGPLGPPMTEVAREVGVGASIGFQAIEYGPPSRDEIERYARDGQSPSIIVRKWKWLELSLTHFPANVSCQTQLVEPGPDLRGRAREAVREGRVSPESANRIRLGSTRIRL